MVCEHCKGVDHNGKPEKCRGGTWCDCNHRPVIKMSQVESEVANNVSGTNKE